MLDAALGGGELVEEVAFLGLLVAEGLLHVGETFLQVGAELGVAVEGGLLAGDVGLGGLLLQGGTTMVCSVMDARFAQGARR